MPRIAWTTDIHLNFVSPEGAEAYCAAVNDTRPDAVLVSGDIAEAPSVGRFLELMARRIAAPIYFVLGNHDYYFGSIRGVRQQMQTLCEAHPSLVFLTAADVVELTPQVGLVGHDGWADARLGDYDNSDVMLNDYRLIEELAHWKKPERRRVLEAMAGEAADAIRERLPRALDRYPQVLLLTHVPPFREACRYGGAISGDDWLPHFSSQVMGETIETILRERPDRQVTVLCGHTHGASEIQPLPNLLVLTGGAEYRAPAVQRELEFP
jgi:predicted MPP superfamily phosphohydrolase